MTYSDHLQWDLKGACKYRVMKKRKCEGQPGYSGGCPGTYNDDYGTRKSCNQCHGTGTIAYWVYIPVPAFNAPKPPKGWVPDWIED